MEGVRKRGMPRKRWTDEAEEDMMIMGKWGYTDQRLEEMEEEFTGSQCPQRTVVHEKY